MAESPDVKSSFLPIGFVLFLFLVSILVPPLGVILGLLAPTPMILVYLQRGKQAGLITVALILAVVLILAGTQHAIIFFAEYAALAVVMAEALRAHFPIEKCVLFSALSSLALSCFFLFLAASEGQTTVTEIFQQQIAPVMDQSLDAMKEMDKPENEIAEMAGFMEKMSQTMAASFPAIIAIGSLLTASVNYALTALLWKRIAPGSTAYQFGKFIRWSSPEQFIWPFIISAGLTFLPDTGLGGFGLNVFIVMLAIYFMQGLAILYHFLESKRVPVFLWPLAILFVFIQPMFMGLIVGLGLFDLWVDFRKVKTQDISE